MVFHASFNNISAIYVAAVNFIGRGNQSTWKKPQICLNSLTNFITQRCVGHTSPSVGFELPSRWKLYIYMYIQICELFYFRWFLVVYLFVVLIFWWLLRNQKRLLV